MSKTAISLVVLLTIFGGACAIGIVWLRMDISDVAARCGVLEDEREVLSREVQELRNLLEVPLCVMDCLISAVSHKIQYIHYSHLRG